MLQFDEKTWIGCENDCSIHGWMCEVWIMFVCLAILSIWQRWKEHGGHFLWHQNGLHFLKFRQAYINKENIISTIFYCHKNTYGLGSAVFFNSELHLTRPWSETSRQLAFITFLWNNTLRINTMHKTRWSI